MIASLLTALYSFYNAAFQPILGMGPYVALAFFSVCLATLFSGVRYWLLDHEKADKIQEKISEKQEKMKEARENDNHEKASEYTKEVFKHNQKFMMLNMKPMIGTMLFVGLIFPWLGATFAPGMPLQQAESGVYEGNFTYGNTQIPITVQNSSEQVQLQLDNQTYRTGESVNINGFDWTFNGVREKSPGIFSSTEGTVAKFNAKFIELPFTLPLIGGAVNWLLFYILIAMPLTFGLNKALGIQ